MAVFKTINRSKSVRSCEEAFVVGRIVENLNPASKKSTILYHHYDNKEKYFYIVYTPISKNTTFLNISVLINIHEVISIMRENKEVRTVSILEKILKK
jgi:hypothetical protein